MRRAAGGRDAQPGEEVEGSRPGVTTEKLRVRPVRGTRQASKLTRTWLHPNGRARGPMAALTCCRVTPPKVYATLCKTSFITFIREISICRDVSLYTRSSRMAVSHKKLVSGEGTPQVCGTTLLSFPGRFLVPSHSWLASCTPRTSNTFLLSFTEDIFMAVAWAVSGSSTQFSWASPMYM